jgi:hypothetical protein
MPVLVVGGEPAQVDAARARAPWAPAASCVHRTTARERDSGLRAAADLLVSRAFAAPTRRSRSLPAIGPIVASNLLTHTRSDAATAKLADPGQSHLRGDA